jgi:hypothetical protein
MVVVVAALVRRLQLLRVLEDLEPLLRHLVSVVLEHRHRPLRLLVPLLVALVLLPLTRRLLERPPRPHLEVSLGRLQQHLREAFSVHQPLLRADSARRHLVQDLEASVRRRHLPDLEEVLLLELPRQHHRVASLEHRLQQLVDLEHRLQQLVGLEALERQLPLLRMEHLHQRPVEAFLEHPQQHRRVVCLVPKWLEEEEEEALK